MSSTRKLLRSILLLILFIVASCSPPDDPVKCSSKDSDCTITNCYGMFPDRSTCRAGNVAYPGTEEEIGSIVSAATKAGKKMKVVTSFAHSIPKLACPDGVDGLLISTKYLNHVVNVDAAAMTMTVESGMALSQLIEEAAKAGLALPYAPYWSGSTIGGVLSTGSHGSSLWGKGSAVHDYVIAMRIVSPGGPDEGYAKIRILNESHEDLNAAKVSLGVLGVISQVTLKLEPMFKRSITYVKKIDMDLGDEAVSFGKQHEFADMSWYPSQRQVVYRVDDRVSPDVSGEGLYDFTGFRDTLSLVAESIRTTEETQESNGLDEMKCVSAGLTTTILGAIAYGLTNNGIIFTGYPVIGYQNRLQSSSSCVNSPENGLITACPWDSRIKGEFFHQTTFKINLSVVQSFIEDVQSLVALEPKSLCGLELYNGILMRYVKASSAYLGSQEDALDFDITYYRSKDPLTPRLYEDILEEIEQMAVFKYGGLPHWGKNRNIAFDGVFKKYRNVTEFLKVKEAYDPSGLFSSEWTDQMLGLKDGLSIVKEGCALEGLCICSQDIHCAPSKGYFCRPGKIYKDARVCTLIK
ncbi:hypothetical protein SLE2022_249270 [Rubroshorea leprosula]